MAKVKLGNLRRRGKLTVVEMVERELPIRAAVRAVLDARGETIASWARTVGVDRVAVTRLLGGRSKVRYEDVRVALCDSFGLERAWLDRKLA